MTCSFEIHLWKVIQPMTDMVCFGWLALFYKQQHWNICLKDMLCSTNALLISHVDYLCHTEMICGMQFYWFTGNETISEMQFCVFGHRVISVLKGYVLQWMCGALLNNLSLMLQYLFTTVTCIAMDNSYVFSFVWGQQTLTEDGISFHSPYAVACGTVLFF